MKIINVGSRIKYSRIMRSIRRAYVRKKYWFVVNDLKVERNMEYDYKGIYPTLYKEKTKNYEKRVKNNYYDVGGVILYKNQGEYVYNAIQIIQQGLEEYGYYIKTKQQEHKNKLDRVVLWLLENQDSETGAWLLKFEFQHPRIESKIENPWISALSQGQGISLMCRMYSLTGEDKFLKSAILAYKVMENDVKEGGVRLGILDGCWLEEYPTEPSSFTLNGFLYSIYGIYDLYMITNEQKYKDMFLKCVKTLEKMLPLYDTKELTYYDLCHVTNPVRVPMTNSKYHVIHIILLNYLQSIYPSEVISFYVDKWDRY